MMSADYFPGFEPLVLIRSNLSELDLEAPAVPFGGEAGNVPVSNRRIPTQGSKIVVFKPGLATLHEEESRGEYSSSAKSSDTLCLKQELRLVVEHETPTGGNGVVTADAVISNEVAPGKPVSEVYADSHRPRGLGRHGDSHNGAASSDAPTDGKGITSINTLGSTDGAPVLDDGVENPGDEKGPRSIQTPWRRDERGSVKTTPPRWNSFRFRVEQFTRSLSLSRLAQVARRPRFYRMPWLRRADEPDTDRLS
jgi:hypothetical protein